MGYFGAEVIKVEPPTGDPIRQWREVRNGMSLWYHSLARNKKSVTLDLKSERGRELATMRVIGFSTRETAYILLGEIALLTFLAMPLGCVFGFGLAYVMADVFTTELFRIPLYVSNATYAWSMLVVLIATLAALAFVGRRVSRLDLIAVLKTRE